MNHPSYLFTRISSERYIFTSCGKQIIEKAVEFSATDKEGLYNIGFGDRLPDGTIDDTAASNNGDIVKVLSTVIQILRAFTTESPEVTIGFTGSTAERTKLYSRILRNYYSGFSEEYSIAAFTISDEIFKEVSFDPRANLDYHAFFVKKII
jgi:hypothetical protein